MTRVQGVFIHKNSKLLFENCSSIHPSFDHSRNSFDSPFLVILRAIDCHKIRKSDTPAVSKVLPMLKPDEPPTDFPYASLVGSLIWLMKTYPDISYAVS